jgi:hypothetical protein
MKAMKLTWQRILEQSPELAELRDGARSIAENERRPWYEDWLPGSMIFSVAIHKAAQRLGVSPEAVRPVALRGLVDAYRTAKGRLQPAALNPKAREWATKQPYGRNPDDRERRKGRNRRPAAAG